MTTTDSFSEQSVIKEIKHYLPAQGPLKDFVHHNTLHAFQEMKFDEAINTASSVFGYKVRLKLDEYRHLFQTNRIKRGILERVVTERKGPENLNEWIDKVLLNEYNTDIEARVGMLRFKWRKYYRVNLDSLSHTTIFRLLSSYLDQGISIWNFPVHDEGFLEAVRKLDKNSLISIFQSKRAKSLLYDDKVQIRDLLELLVGDKSLYEQYLFDQQFAHQGWSGLVSYIEDHPEALFDQKKISLKDLIHLELLIEIDKLDVKLGNNWKPLASSIKNKPIPLFAKVEQTELNDVVSILHEAFEWSYYDEVLAAIRVHEDEKKNITEKSFQAMFCIDDREASLRRYIETIDQHCETFATPGFFNVEFYYRPNGGKFLTKLCPPPVTPKFLICEKNAKEKKTSDISFSKGSHSLLFGWIHAQILGLWSAIRLIYNIFHPSMSAATATSFRHMDKLSTLTIENKDPKDKENDLQIGFTIEEMETRVETLLRSIGLVSDFAPLIYVIGHGASSVNNPHYAAYDCGACSGRPGSVNARVFSYMANHPDVRARLREKGVNIQNETQFLGGLHDTTRDEMIFFDEVLLNDQNRSFHLKNKNTFNQALDLNSKERSRRFDSIETKQDPEKIHDQIRKRSVSLFEPRPELNHATNSLCIIAPRALTRDVFLDRRAFFNSYNYKVDRNGDYLLNILKAAAPVCGGINLEYYFSRVDNYKLGAGTKLPHNVMGLIGVANGIEGDLRPGLPSQMIEVHEPVRLLMIIEHFADVVLSVLQRSPETNSWFLNEWIGLIVIDPETEIFYRYVDGKFEKYETLQRSVEHIADIKNIIESDKENLNVYIIK